MKNWFDSFFVFTSTLSSVVQILVSVSVFCSRWCLSAARRPIWCLSAAERPIWCLSAAKRPIRCLSAARRPIRAPPRLLASVPRDIASVWLNTDRSRPRRVECRGGERHRWSGWEVLGGVVGEQGVTILVRLCSLFLCWSYCVPLMKFSSFCYLCWSNCVPLMKFSSFCYLCFCVCLTSFLDEVLFLFVFPFRYPPPLVFHVGSPFQLVPCLCFNSSVNQTYRGLSSRRQTHRRQ